MNKESVNVIPRQKGEPRIYTLRKYDKLRHRSLVNALFEEGESMYEFPIRMVYRVIRKDALAGEFRNEVPDNIGKMQMMVTVPKKKRHFAVDRVYIRRRIREAYRIHRLSLLDDVEEDPSIDSLSIAFIYVSDKNRTYESIERRVVKLLDRLQETLYPSTPPQNNDQP